MNGTARVNVVSDQNKRTEIKAAVNIWRQVTRIRGPPKEDINTKTVVKTTISKKYLIKKFIKHVKNKK